MVKKTPPDASSKAPSERPQSDPTKKPFTPDTLDRTVIAIPLLDRIEADGVDAIQNIIIDVNLEYPGGRKQARDIVWRWVDDLPGVDPTHESSSIRRQLSESQTAKAARTDGLQGINRSKSEYSQQYLFGRLSGENIRSLVRRNEKERDEGKEASSNLTLGASALYRIWLDHEVSRFTNLSISTVKADAARKSFGAHGRDIVWAVIDTGVDRNHPHFKLYDNLNLGPPLQHRDFTGSGQETGEESARRACIDKTGHGTHVAGIIAGQFRASAESQIIAMVRRRDETGDVLIEQKTDILEISGMAPQCKLLSLKVLDDKGEGLASNLIAALEYIQELNGNGRRIRIHGVNMSVGYDFEPKWFACGQSPVCIEVDRLVRSGTVVVVAAGNTGYGFNETLGRGLVPAGQDLTINDPGNADLAITVGSTHRDMPHVYGVSYFSSKGPTGDGRIKPDIVAPGEKIISCQSAQVGIEGEAASPGLASHDKPLSSGPRNSGSAASSKTVAHYKEDSGTSMAAPHVSGVIAAFLSVRREFIGRPEAIKDIFLSTATDLKRAVYFQGKGLVDLMRAIQSI